MLRSSCSFATTIIAAGGVVQSTVQQDLYLVDWQF
jgi:hypothetical protein